MEGRDVYSGGSDWAHTISRAIWHSELSLPCSEHEYYPENPQFDFINWFLGEPCYNKLKQH